MKSINQMIKDNELIIDLNNNAIKGYTTQKDLKKQFEKLREMV